METVYNVYIEYGMIYGIKRNLDEFIRQVGETRLSRQRLSYLYCKYSSWFFVSSVGMINFSYYGNSAFSYSILKAFTNWDLTG